MFEKKYDIPTICDSYIDLYNTCNIGCKHCKFQIARTNNIVENNIDFSKYNNKKILFCYSVDPYPLGFDNNNLVRKTIEQLHEQKNRIVFLTRRAQQLNQDLDIFTTEDIVGVSISENCDDNSSDAIIMKMYQNAKQRGLNTWMSLEPVLSAQFANKIINQYKEVVDFIRIGKDDLKTYEWQKVKTQLQHHTSPKIFIK